MAAAVLAMVELSNGRIVESWKLAGIVEATETMTVATVVAAAMVASGNG